MSIQKNSDIQPIQGSEGTQIKQYFHPHNTLNGINYSLAQFTLQPGKKTLKHKLKSSEIYYILEGQAVLQIDGDSFEIKKEDSAYVAPNSEQSIRNTGTSELRFLCIVEPAWKADDETILE